MDEVLARIGEAERPTALIAIAAFCAIEYLFPPFPGDAAMIAGAFLVAARGWPLVPVLGAATAGSMTGAFGHYWIGRWLVLRNWDPKGPRGRKLKHAVLAAVHRFERHGALYLAMNRFLPGVRSVFFLAAGYARLPLWRVMGWGVVSAILWNLLLVGTAFLVGRRWERLVDLVRTYALVGWGIVLLTVVALYLGSRRKR